MASSSGMRVLIKQWLIEPNSNKKPEPGIERAGELHPEEVVDLDEINDLYGSTEIDDEENQDEIEKRSDLEVSDYDFSKSCDIDFDEFGKTEAIIVEPQFKLGLAELLDENNVVPLSVYGNSEVEISGILHDSRVLESGDLFVCCVRRKTNGHLYLYEADKRGAVAVVEDTNVILAASAASFFRHPCRSMSVVGFKLTNWKTTTSVLTEGIYEVMGLRTGMLNTVTYYVHGDNKVESTQGTPDDVSVQNLMANIVHDGKDALVIEALSHDLALGRRAVVDFDTAHHHKILNIDDLNTMFFIAQGNPDVPVVTFAVKNKNANVHPLTFGSSRIVTQVLVNTPQCIKEISLGLLGRHNICNILSSVAVGAPPEDIVRGIEEVDAVPGRCKFIYEEQALRVIVDSDYTPHALSRLLFYARQLAPRWMYTALDCACETDEGKRPMMTNITMDKSDATILTSENPRNEDNTYWAELHYDMLVSILEKIELIQDFVAFGSVCKPWCEVASNNKTYLCPQIPWLMLPEDDNHCRRIYSLSKGNILTKNLYIPEMSDKRCIGLNYGWVLTISRRRRGDMSLVHPLSRSVIELPPQTSIEEYEEYRTWPSYFTTRRAALSGNPSKSDDFVLMILHSGGHYLGFWRQGDKRWTRVEQEDHFADLTYYQDQFYALTLNGQVWGCKVNHDDPNIVARLITTIDYRPFRRPDRLYIVGSVGGLLVLTRHEKLVSVGSPVVASPQEEEEGFQENVSEEEEGEYSEEDIDDEAFEYWLINFAAYELDLINGGCKQIKDLGNTAIFVGLNTSISFDHASKLSRIKSNHVYFTDDLDEFYPNMSQGGGKDMGTYNLEDGQITKIEIDQSLSRFNPPFWFIPSL